MADAKTQDSAPAITRGFVLPGLFLTAVELGMIVWPLNVLFRFSKEQEALLVRTAGPVLAGSIAVWYLVLGSLLTPVRRLVAARRQPEAERPSDPSLMDMILPAHRALARIPLRALWLRMGLWVGVGIFCGAILVVYSDWQSGQVITLAALSCLLAYLASMLRAIWYARVASGIRAHVFLEAPPLYQFSARYYQRLLLVTFFVNAAAIGALAAFTYFFLPIDRQEYLQVHAYLPGTLAIVSLVLNLWIRRAKRPIDAYLETQLEPAKERPVDAKAAYRAAQVLPYRLVAAKVILWFPLTGAVALAARYGYDMEADNAVLMFGAAVVLIVGSVIYEAIWHRATMRPLLSHLRAKHRLPLRDIRTSLSMRTKLLVSFGGLVLFACGLSLFWGFIQYKKLVTSFVEKQAQLKLDWVRSEIQGGVKPGVEPSAPIVKKVLEQAGLASLTDGAVYVFAPALSGERIMSAGGGKDGAPRVPWYALARMHGGTRGVLEIGSLHLSGNFQRLFVDWEGKKAHLGSVAVLYPSYRGRGPGIQRPLKELWVFFLVLFGACAGIVVLTVGEFTQPIRQLEQRANEMAHGELSHPVTALGEGDEVGRLTFAIEEMRLALREKLRTTEESNLDLEREVQKRTADLARKNRELADALEKLRRAQSQLVRSEKMASIGQLVAGIAHEINNPVNAIVNSVGPLSDSIEEIAGASSPEASKDILQMVEVVKRGAKRTKEIVQALHNYSRTDEERIVDFDLNRGIEDSLELLRHHLKGSISVVRKLDDVGRIKGHAGQINQVLMNLITNAAQALAGQENAVIEIVTKRQGAEVVIKISDNGPGMPEDILAKIFDPFFTTKEVGQGSGLGLSIVHGIVERHGGTIEVESHVGQGTVFAVTLPSGGQ